MKKNLPVLGLVMTQKNEAAMLNHNIEYHRYMGVSRFYIFDDGSTDSSMQTIQNTCGVHQFFGTDFSIAPEELADVKQRAIEGNWVGRQLLNTYKALQLAKEHHVDWLLLVDTDELIFFDDIKKDSFCHFFSKVKPDVDIVYYKKVYEIVPQNIITTNISKNASLFKTTAYDENVKRQLLDPITGKMFSHTGFFGPSRGKQAARVNVGLIPKSVHYFKKQNGNKVNTLIRGQVMHYHICNFSDFLKRVKSKHPNQFPSGKAVSYYPKLFWRDLLIKSQLSEKELRVYFEEWVMLPKNEINELKKQSIDGEPLLIENVKIRKIWEQIEKEAIENSEKTITLKQNLPVLGLVMTQKNEAAMLNHNIEYHRFMGVSRFYIFDDGSTDGSMQTIKNTQGVHQFFETDFSITPKEMADVKQKAIDGNWIGRQYLNTYKALQLAKEDGVDWLIFIDADELVFLGSEEESSFLSFFESVKPDIDAVFFKKVYEVIPQNLSTSNIFKKATLFKTTAYDKNAEKTMFDPMSDEMFSLSGFLGPSLGKQAARVSADLIPESSHRFKNRNGESPKTLINGQVIHYHLYDFDDFIKRSSIKHPSHYIYDRSVPYYPKIFWRKLTIDSGLRKSELRDYYKRWIVFSEEYINCGKNRFEDDEAYIVKFNRIVNVWKKIEDKMSDDIKSILIQKYNATFTVLSKNACTSTKAHIIKTLGLPQTVNYPRDIHRPGIYNYPYISDEKLTTTYYAYLRFCIIRNPWSRLVSCFKDKIKPTPVNNFLYKNGVHIRLIRLSSKFQSGMSFEDFVDIISKIPDSEADAHFRSQLYDILASSGELRINYIAKLEYLKEHLEEIKQLSGMPFEEFPTLNTTEKKKSYTDYYTPKIIQKVRKRYEGDIEVFGYQFGKKDKFHSGIINSIKEKQILDSPFFSKILEEKNNAIRIKKKKVERGKFNKQKIFCIGLNKTGTRSLSAALDILGFNAAHYKSPIGRIGEIFKANVENNRKLLTGLEDFDAFLDWIDMEGTNNHFFRMMDEQHPDSKFIFTNRNIEAWVESRIKHVKKTSRLKAFQKAYPESTWYNMNTVAWQAEFNSHKAEILNYFKDRQEDLLIFDVFKGDSWEKLCSFLQIPIPNRPFPVRGKSSYTKQIFIQPYFIKGNIFLKDRKTIFYFLPGIGNLPIKSSLISYVERKKKFEFPQNAHLVSEFPFPFFNKKPSHPSIQNHFKFTIVRNPWDRLVAFYQDMICSDDLDENFFKVGIEESFNEYGNFFQRNMPFKKFVEKVCLIPESKANRHFCSQMYQLTTPSGDLLVNYIGHYENLQKAALDIFDQTQISLHEIPTSKGKIRDTSYTSMYSEELQEKVRKKFAADIEYFGYEFGVPYQGSGIGFVPAKFISQFSSSSFYIDILKEKNLQLSNQLMRTSQEVNRFKQHLSRRELQSEGFMSDYKLIDYQKKFKDIQSSLSWKITAPLRFIGDILIKYKKNK